MAMDTTIFFFLDALDHHTSRKIVGLRLKSLNSMDMV